MDQGHDSEQGKPTIDLFPLADETAGARLVVHGELVRPRDPHDGHVLDICALGERSKALVFCSTSSFQQSITRGAANDAAAAAPSGRIHHGVEHIHFSGVPPLAMSTARLADPPDLHENPLALILNWPRFCGTTTNSGLGVACTTSEWKNSDCASWRSLHQPLAKRRGDGLRR